MQPVCPESSKVPSIAVRRYLLSCFVNMVRITVMRSMMLTSRIFHRQPDSSLHPGRLLEELYTLGDRRHGAGFVKSGDLLGCNLRGTRSRAASVSAKFEIISQLGSATRVEVDASCLRTLRHAAFSEIAELFNGDDAQCKAKTAVR